MKVSHTILESTKFVIFLFKKILARLLQKHSEHGRDFFQFKLLLHEVSNNFSFIKEFLFIGRIVQQLSNNMLCHYLRLSLATIFDYPRQLC